jgi:hypothetical protein
MLRFVEIGSKAQGELRQVARATGAKLPIFCCVATGDTSHRREQRVAQIYIIKRLTGYFL